MAVNQFPPGLDIGNEHHPLSGVFNILKRMVHTDAYVAWDAFRAGYNMHTVRAWDVEEVPESRVPPYFAATSIRSLQGLHGNTRVGGGDAFPFNPYGTGVQPLVQPRSASLTRRHVSAASAKNKFGFSSCKG